MGRGQRHGRMVPKKTNTVIDDRNENKYPYTRKTVNLAKKKMIVVGDFPSRTG